MSRVRYFDSSAIVKLVVDEPESVAASLCTNRVGRGDQHRRHRRSAPRRSSTWWDRSARDGVRTGGFEVIDLDRQIAELAIGTGRLRCGRSTRSTSRRRLHPGGPRGTGHLRRRMIEAARQAGLPVVSPGMEIADSARGLIERACGRIGRTGRSPVREGPAAGDATAGPEVWRSVRSRAAVGDGARPRASMSSASSGPSCGRCRARQSDRRGSRGSRGVVGRLGDHDEVILTEGPVGGLEPTPTLSTSCFTAAMRLARLPS